MKNKIETDTLLNKLVAAPFYLKLLREKNTIEAEYEALKENVEDGLFSERERIITLEAIVAEQRKRLRAQAERIKELKESDKLQRARKNKRREG